MPRNPHRKGTSASTSFRKDEVDAAVAIFAAVIQGSDAKIILATKAGNRLHRKLLRMRDSIREKKSGA